MLITLHCKCFNIILYKAFISTRVSVAVQDETNYINWGVCLNFTTSAPDKETEDGMKDK